MGVLVYNSIKRKDLQAPLVCSGGWPYGGKDVLVCPTGGNYELRACTDRLFLIWKAGCKGVGVLGRDYSYIGNKRQ